MLTLTRKQGESIKIGRDILVVVTQTKRGSVRLSIDAPRDMNICRKEIYDAAIAEARAGEPVAPDDRVVTTTDGTGTTPEVRSA